MAYYVDHTTLSVKQSSCGTDFQTEQAAQNALEDYVRLNTTYGIDIENVEVIRGGEYTHFQAAKSALIDEMSVALRADGQSADAYDRYRRAWDVKNPNEPSTFESMGFAPHQPLTALNL